MLEVGDIYKSNWEKKPEKLNNFIETLGRNQSFWKSIKTMDLEYYSSKDVFQDRQQYDTLLSGNGLGHVSLNINDE